MPYLLAIDGGGTKTNALCADDQGQVLGEGTTGPTNLTATNVGAASFNLKEAIRQATQGLEQGWQVDRLVMGLAGMDTPAEAEKAKEVFNQVVQQYNIAKFTLVNDIVIALASGTDKPDAVALISGTGSNCYGRNNEGHEVKIGGMDYLLTDQGSGYEIGRYVLRTAVKSFDGRIEKTVLEEMVCQHFNIGSIGNLKDVVYNPLLDKAEIAELSKIALRAFDQGDNIAREIFDHVIEELFLMVSTAMVRLGMTGRPVDLVLVGSITKIPYVEERLSEKVKGQNSQVQIVTPDKDPVHGALSIALHEQEQQTQQ